jgi:hypothetical protein
MKVTLDIPLKYKTKQNHIELWDFMIRMKGYNDCPNQLMNMIINQVRLHHIRAAAECHILNITE